MLIPLSENPYGGKEYGWITAGNALARLNAKGAPLGTPFAAQAKLDSSVQDDL